MENHALNPKTENTDEGVVVGGDGDGASATIEQIPNDILVDILSRLPIKSLTHCRSVFKLFLNLISEDPEFPPLHISRSPPELMLYTQDTRKMVLIDSDADQAHELNFGFEEAFGMELVNSARGLLCLRQQFSSEPISVLNPLTLEYILIQNPPRERQVLVTVWAGLGYSPMSDKYKLIKLLKSCSSINGRSGFLTEIYTLGSPSSSWRRIQDAPMDELTCCFSTILGGSLHWLMNENTSFYSYDYLVYFDMDKEEFGEIRLPPPFDIEVGRDIVNVVSFGVFEGQLCLSVLKDDRSTHVWVMKEYGVHQSWCLEIVVKLSPIYLPEPIISSFPVKYMKDNNGEEVLIFIVNNVVITYSLLKEKVVKYNTFPAENGEWKALIHVPIMHSLKELLAGADDHVNLLNLTGSKAWRRSDDKLVSTYEEST